MAYDELTACTPTRASHEYLAVLELAAKESETGVDAALRQLIAREAPITAEAVKAILHEGQPCADVQEVTIDGIDLSRYDALLSEREVLV